MYIESENRMVYCCKKMKDYFEIDKCIFFSEAKRKICFDNLEQNTINYCPFCGKKILIKGGK